MTAPYPIALLGCGIVAGPHAKAIARHDGVAAVGVYDPDREKAAAIAERLGARVYRDLDEVLADRGVEAVIVATPTATHCEVACRALEAGKHVLLEKPVSETPAEIKRLGDTAARQNVVCMPAHNYIYQPTVERMRRLIGDGSLGDLSSLWILYNISHSEELAAAYGGVLREVCVHHVYSLIYLAGRPRRATAVAANVHYEHHDFEDQVMIVCELDGGAIANLWSSFAASDPTFDPWTVIYKALGTKGGAADSWNEAWFDDQGGPAWGVVDYLDGFANELAFFVDRAIGRGEAPLSTLDDALATLRVIEACETAMHERRSGVEVAYDDA